VTPLLRHDDRVNHVAFSPDGQMVLTASQDRTARLWKATTGEPAMRPLTHGGNVTQASFSPDGRRVATASSDYTARVWDGQTGDPVTSPLKHSLFVSEALFSPDGRRLFTQGASEVRVWDLSPDSRPAEDIVLGSQVLACRRLDAHGGLVPSEPPADDYDEHAFTVAAALRVNEWALIPTTPLQGAVAAVIRYPLSILPPQAYHKSRSASLKAQRSGEVPAWYTLRGRYPEMFSYSNEEVLTWHRQQAVACVRERNPAAAMFHILHGSWAWPLRAGWPRP
jgi:hypothetical protein